MAKRTATSDLNHENWDREDDAEEAGTFAVAADEVIKKRVIKVARRRNPISSINSSEESKPNVFGGFTAFSKTPATETSSATSSSSSSGTSSSSAQFGFLANLAKKPEEPSKMNGDSSSHINKDGKDKAADKKSDEYYAKLKGLNESVTEWIKSHVSENPFVNLQPIFRDYEKFFSELEKPQETNKAQYSFGSPNDTSKPTVNNAPIPTFSFTANQNNPKFTFGVADTTSQPSSITSTAPKFSFGASNKPTTTSQTSPTSVTPPKFSFGSNKANTMSTSGSRYSFENNSALTSTSQSPATVGFCNTSTMINTSGGGAPFLSFGDKTTTTSVFGASDPPKFSFGSAVVKPSTITTTAATSQDKNEDVNEDEPPKVEFTPVVEDGHVYTIRCKVFVKKDGAFGDRGVGNLYLKPISDSDKYQLVVRAETNLGNLLCNFILSEGIPTKRLGKKDVMLVCLPTPDTKPPPVPILLRVKTTEEADELLKTLEKFKK